ncbi:hypothetical protein GDO81_008213 [Engystomops pustulosus]|uniref:Uncharacterized protein n=1 Tax=Engystomops pustulosus TaxID=76066 RepID=A0AAV7CFH3_ENGPU|nr:hypothetical protein GDO81_008213 [Engystomops pustulosus]
MPATACHINPQKKIPSQQAIPNTESHVVMIHISISLYNDRSILLHWGTCQCQLTAPPPACLHIRPPFPLSQCTSPEYSTQLVISPH